FLSVKYVKVVAALALGAISMEASVQAAVSRHRGKCPYSKRNTAELNIKFQIVRSLSVSTNFLRHFGFQFGCCTRLHRRVSSTREEFRCLNWKMDPNSDYASWRKLRLRLSSRWSDCPNRSCPKRKDSPYEPGKCGAWI